MVLLGEYSHILTLCSLAVCNFKLFFKWRYSLQTVKFILDIVPFYRISFDTVMELPPRSRYKVFPSFFSYVGSPLLVFSKVFLNYYF